MVKELEIEYKNMLEQLEYEKLLSFFQRTEGDAQKQTNHYFDTPGFELKNQCCALRIREKGDSFECTLKIPAPEGNFEITDVLSAVEAQQIMNGLSFPAPEVQQALRDLAVVPADLVHIGTLATHRIEFPFESGLLVLDRSEYLDITDFEVEFEVTDAAVGQLQFMDFLKQQQIPLRPADKKIARFMTAAHKKSPGNFS